MPHFIEIKKQVKKDILTAVDRTGQIDYSKTLSEFSLNTGFTEKKIGEIIEQMIKLNYIESDGVVIKRPKSNENSNQL